MQTTKNLKKLTAEFDQIVIEIIRYLKKKNNSFRFYFHHNIEFNDYATDGYDSHSMKMLEYI